MKSAVYSFVLEGYEWLHSNFMPLFKVIHTGPDPQKTFDSLPPMEQKRYALTQFLTETTNGGLDQYFWNGSGDEWKILQELFSELNLETCQATLQACAQLFDGEGPSTDSLKRRKQIEAFYDRGTNIDKLVEYSVDRNVCTKFVAAYKGWREQAGSDDMIPLRVD